MNESWRNRLHAKMGAALGESLRKVFEEVMDEKEMAEPVKDQCSDRSGFAKDPQPPETYIDEPFFKVGDVVRLNSGSHDMTVFELHDEQPLVKVAFQSITNQSVSLAVMPAACLTLVGPTAYDNEGSDNEGSDIE